MRRKTATAILTALLLPGALTALAQTTWTKWPANPVFSGFNGNSDNPVVVRYALEPNVVYDWPTGVYRMWYTSLTFGGQGLAINGALSLNGIDWFVQNDGPALDVAESQRVFDVTVRNPRVVSMGSSFAMYYMGTDSSGKGSIGLATSQDGIHFTRHGAYPVLSGGSAESWDSGGAGFEDVRKEDSTYYIWYSGGNSTTSGLGLARSTDGVEWVKDPANPILIPTLASEQPYVLAPSVVKVGGLYYMFYLAGPYASRSVYVAYSTDKVHWTKASNGPILTGGSQSWETGTLGNISVIYLAGEFRMWYSALSQNGSWQTGYATSAIEPLSSIRAKSNPAASTLSQNFPNPFNPATAIDYTVAGDTGVESSVKLVVYDEIGRQVAVLVDEKQAAGSHRAVFDGSRFASGIYYYRLQIGGVTHTKTMTLVK